MKRIICLTLALVMLAAMLVGCKKDEETPVDSGTVSTVESADESAEETRKPLLTEDLKGQKITLAVRNERYHYLYQDKESEDRIESATFYRNSEIEKLYNCELAMYEVVGNSAGPWITMLTGAENGDYDICVPDYWYLLETHGFMYNLRDENTFGGVIDYSDEWWTKGWTDNVTMNNRAYSIVGDGSLELVENVEVVFYNKQMAENAHIDMYALVDNNEWTVDKMLELSENASSITDDGNDANDVYGSIYDLSSFATQLFAAGVKLTKVATNGSIEIVAGSQTYIDIAEAVEALVTSTHNKYIGTTCRTGEEDKVAMFAAKKCLFYSNAFYHGETIKAKVSSGFYGVVPQPKYDKEMPYTSAIYGVSPFYIPNCAKNPRASALILNAMNYLSEETIVDAYYEIMLKGQVASEYDDARMIDLARDSLYIDFAWVHDTMATNPSDYKLRLWSLYERGICYEAAGMENYGFNSFAADRQTVIREAESGLAHIQEFYKG